MQPYEMNAPDEQLMTTHTDLEAIDGVVIQQVAQYEEVLLQAVGVPYEARNMYLVKHLPAGVKHALRDQQQADGWRPTAQELDDLPVFMTAQEESSWVWRCVLAAAGCVNLRPLTLHYREAGAPRPPPHGQKL